MTIHILVEGPSELAFLEPWTRRLLGEQRVRIHPHEGKGTLPQDLDAPPDRWNRALLHQLPATVRCVAAAATANEDGVVVLLDADNDDPHDLKLSIENVAGTLAPKLKLSVAVAVEETEAFYLGDLNAVKRGFPDADLELAKGYEPDSICGTWEYFGRVIGDNGGNKLAWATTMGPRVTTRPERSRSPSFRTLIAALRQLIEAPPALKKRRNFHHRSSKDKRS